MTGILSIDTARVFKPLLEPAPYKGAHGGRGSGKSHFFAELLVEDSMAEPGNSGGEGLRSVCMRTVQRDLAQSSKALIEAKLRKFGLGEAQGFKVYESEIATPGDGVIIFKGMNNYTADSIKSLEGFKRGWWEEAHTATATALGMYTPTLRANGAERWFSWNPRLRTDALDVLLRGPQIPTGARVVRANWRDNPWLTAELQRERDDCLRINPDQYPHIWEGDYVSVISGAYWARELAAAKAQGRIGRVPADPLLTIRLFVDIGGTGARADNFVIWAVQFVGREIRVLDHYEAQGQPIGAHLEWCMRQGYRPGRAQWWLPHDGAQQDKVQDTSYEAALKAADYDVTVVPNQGKGAAKARIEAARRVFPAVWFNEATTDGGRAALGWYHEKKDEARGIGLGPEHDWASHSADAFGLMAIVYEAPTVGQDEQYAGRGAGGWMG